MKHIKRMKHMLRVICRYDNYFCDQAQNPEDLASIQLQQPSQGPASASPNL